jgi:hypothetical protein
MNKPHTLGNESCIFHVNILTLKGLGFAPATGFVLGGRARSDCAERGGFFLCILVVGGECGAVDNSP